MHGTKNPDGTWDIYENNTLKSDNLVLPSGSPVSLRWKLSANGEGDSSGGSSAMFLLLYNFNTSGIRLKRTDGFYATNVSFCFESERLTTTANDITRIFIDVTAFNPLNTSIDSFTSNDNGTTYEIFVPGTFHTFDSIGNEPKMRFCLNSTENLTSPYIPNYRVQIIPSAPVSLSIDIGADGITDMLIDNELNSTTTPIRYNGTDLGFNNYINSSCQSLSDCSIPISFTVGSGGLIEISNFNATQNINPVRLNITAIQTLNSIPFSITYSGGNVQLIDVRFDFRGSKNITVVTHDGTYANSLNKTILVKYSPFSLTFPSVATAWEIFPSQKNQSNIEPFGQNSSHGIWELRSLAYDGNISIWSRYNNSIDTCVTKQEFRSQDFSVSLNNSLSTLNITNLTTSNQPIISNLNSSLVANIRSFTMINCSESTAKLIIPYFCFNSLCSECVLTQDRQDACMVTV